jgi:hypothetical protein
VFLLRPSSTRKATESNWLQGVFRNARAVEERLLRAAVYGRRRLRHESFTVGISCPSIESIDALDDLGANSWRERRFGAHLDKTRSSKHLRRRGIVAGHATIKWSGRFDRKERTEGL